MDIYTRIQLIDGINKILDTKYSKLKKKELIIKIYQMLKDKNISNDEFQTIMYTVINEKEKLLKFILKIT